MSLRRVARRAIRALILAAILPPAAAPARAQAADTSSHVEGTVTGTIVESPEAMKVTTRILCFCGGCANQNLHDCTCGLAEQERRKVAASLSAGATPESLIAAYMAEHGPQILVVPEKRGLNLIGWWVPFVAAAAALIGVLMVLRGWARRSAESAAAGVALSPGAREAERTYRDRLARDLKEFDA